MHEKPSLRCTRDYSVFSAHQFNRPMHEDRRLLDSMKRHGFMPSSPIQCQRNGQELRVIRGHHRLEYAKRLGLPVWYVVDESNTNIFDLEAGLQAWSVNDFANHHASHGDPNCAAILAFQKKHGLTLGAAASLVGGESAGSNNKIRAIKSGTFKAASDQTYANLVVSITDHCRALGITFATTTAFVAAVSLVLRVPEFEPRIFMRRVTLNPGLMTKQSTEQACLEEIETLYNYQAKEKRIPLAFRAREVSKARQLTFAGHKGIPRKAKVTA